MIKGQLNQSFNNMKEQIGLHVVLVVCNKTAVDFTFFFF